MQIERLDHVNLRTTQLQKMVNWYEATLGMTSGARPDFPFAGAWLYAGQHALVHLIEIDTLEAVGSEAQLKLEHFAFWAVDAVDFEARLDASKETYKKVVIEQTNTVAFNVWDPDGNHIHVDFDKDALA